MKPETRGIVEKSLDDLLLVDLLVDIQWIEHEMPVKSFKDLFIGYFIGAAMAVAFTDIFESEKRTPTIEDRNEFMAIIKRRLSEIITRFEKEFNR